MVVLMFIKDCSRISNKGNFIGDKDENPAAILKPHPRQSRSSSGIPTYKDKVGYIDAPSSEGYTIRNRSIFLRDP